MQGCQMARSLLKTRRSLYKQTQEHFDVLKNSSNLANPDQQTVDSRLLTILYIF